jgi:hypothetical protein
MGMVQSSCARPGDAKLMMPRTVAFRVMVAVEVAVPAWMNMPRTMRGAAAGGGDDGGDARAGRDRGGSGAGDAVHVAAGGRPGADTGDVELVDVAEGVGVVLQLVDGGVDLQPEPGCGDLVADRGLVISRSRSSGHLYPWK